MDIEKRVESFKLVLSKLGFSAEKSYSEYWIRYDNREEIYSADDMSEQQLREFMGGFLKYLNENYFEGGFLNPNNIIIYIIKLCNIYKDKLGCESDSWYTKEKISELSEKSIFIFDDEIKEPANPEGLSYFKEENKTLSELMVTINSVVGIDEELDIGGVLNEVTLYIRDYLVSDYYPSSLVSLINKLAETALEMSRKGYSKNDILLSIYMLYCDIDSSEWFAFTDLTHTGRNFESFMDNLEDYRILTEENKELMEYLIEMEIPLDVDNLEDKLEYFVDTFEEKLEDIEFSELMDKLYEMGLSVSTDEISEILYDIENIEPSDEIIEGLSAEEFAKLVEDMANIDRYGINEGLPEEGFAKLVENMRYDIEYSSDISTELSHGDSFTPSLSYLFDMFELIYV